MMHLKNDWYCEPPLSASITGVIISNASHVLLYYRLMSKPYSVFSTLGNPSPGTPAVS
jgi:hypothetical protein